ITFATNTGNISASAPTLGSGGSITLTAKTDVNVDSSATIRVGAAGPRQDNGGSISITADNLTNLSGNTLGLDASATGFGNGGSVSIILSNPNSALNIGPTGDLQIKATGGSVGSPGGSGGSITVSVGNGLTVDNATLGNFGLDAAPL